MSIKNALLALLFFLPAAAQAACPKAAMRYMYADTDQLIVAVAGGTAPGTVEVKRPGTGEWMALKGAKSAGECYSRGVSYRQFAFNVPGRRNLAGIRTARIDGAEVALGDRGPADPLALVLALLFMVCAGGWVITLRR